MASDNTDIYEIDVELRQSAIVAVEATSREEAWEALQMNQSRDVEEVLAKTYFKGAEYEPQHVMAVNDVDEADMSIVE